MNFHDLNEVWWEHRAERRLLVHDVFYGFQGRLWMVMPAFATCWQPNDPNVAFQLGKTCEQHPPTIMFTDEVEPGFVSEVTVDGDPPVEMFREDKHPILLAWDMPAHPDHVTVTVATGEATLETVVEVPDPPSGQVSCAATTESVNPAGQVEDWIRHCRSIGVERFYVYDNNLPPYEPYRFDDADVTVIRWPTPTHFMVPSYPHHRTRYDGGDMVALTWLGSQLAHQAHALYKYAPLCGWLFFADTDEYPNLLQYGSLQELLAQDEGRAAVTLGSVFYGEREEEDAETVTGRYLWREPLVETQAYGRRKPLVRAANMRPGERVVVHDYAEVGNEMNVNVLRKEPFTAERWRQVPLDEARINHYYACRWQSKLVRHGLPGDVFVDEFDDSILR